MIYDNCVVIRNMRVNDCGNIAGNLLLSVETRKSFWGLMCYFYLRILWSIFMVISLWFVSKLIVNAPNWIDSLHICHKFSMLLLRRTLKNFQKTISNTNEKQISIDRFNLKGFQEYLEFHTNLNPQIFGNKESYTLTHNFARL